MYFDDLWEDGYSLRTTMGPRQFEPPPNADLTNDTDRAHNDHTITRVHKQHPNRSQQPPGPTHTYTSHQRTDMPTTTPVAPP